LDLLNLEKIQQLLSGAIRKHMFSMRSEYMHPFLGIRALAYFDTINYIKNNLTSAVVCIDQNEVFNHAIANIEFEGLNAEFGVKDGKTIKMLCQKNAFKNKIIYGFDSFEGLPEDWAGTRVKKGRLTRKGVIPKLPKNIVAIKGWFADTLPEFLNNKNNKFSFIHIDCDIYKSTKDIFDNIENFVRKGTVIVFDEYFNYPNWQEHEYKAFQEFIANKKLKYKYLAYATTQVAVKII
jgi:hypothetical protein